jgi:hypothetical protein
MSSAVVPRVSVSSSAAESVAAPDESLTLMDSYDDADAERRERDAVFLLSRARIHGA